MKKLLSFALILMVCCTSALLFAGCDTNSAKIEIKANQTLEFNQFKNNPDDPEKRSEQEQYEDDRLIALGTIIVTFTADDKAEAEELTLKQVEERGGRVSGFSLKYAGTRTATVTLDGASDSFKYTVKEAA